MKTSLLSIRWLGVLAVMLPNLAVAQTRGKATAKTSGAAAVDAPDTATAAADTAGSDTDNSSTADSTAAAPAAAPAAPPIAPPPVAMASAKAEPPAPFMSDIGVQRVPSSGYPTYKTRGIYGGSLWLTFHGLQWPYMPQKAGEPALMLGLSGYGWVDTAYEKISLGNPVNTNQKLLRQQGRFVVRATPTYRTGNWFVQGQAELVANTDQQQARGVSPDTDDLWLRAGLWNAFDIQAGRFQAWELYHLGMGLDLNTFERRGAYIDGNNYLPPDFYGVTFAWDRPTGPGNIAAHVYFTDWLRLEALTQLGNSGGLNNSIGSRNALIFDVGFFKLKAGQEYLTTKDVSEATHGHFRQWGYGGTAQFIIDPYVEFGGNGAYGQQDTWNSDGAVDETNSWTTYSYGGFANAHLIENLIAGAGLNYTYREDLHIDSVTGSPGKKSQTQVFAALQYGLWRQLFLKMVLGYADAHFIDNSFDNALPFHRKMYSGRLRASFYF